MTSTTQEIALSADDLADLMHGRSITTLARDGSEVEVYPPDGWVDPDKRQGTRAAAFFASRVVCERHPDKPWPHDDCSGPGKAAG